MSIRMLKLILAFILEWTDLMSSLLLLLCSLDRVTMLFIQRYWASKAVYYACCCHVAPFLYQPLLPLPCSFLSFRKITSLCNGLSSASFYMFYPARLDEPMLVPKAPRKLSFSWQYPFLFMLLPCLLSARFTLHIDLILIQGEGETNFLTDGFPEPKKRSWAPEDLSEIGWSTNKSRGHQRLEVSSTTIAYTPGPWLIQYTPGCLVLDQATLYTSHCPLTAGNNSSIQSKSQSIRPYAFYR